MIVDDLYPKITSLDVSKLVKVVRNLPNLFQNI